MTLFLNWMTNEEWLRELDEIRDKNKPTSIINVIKSGGGGGGGGMLPNRNVGQNQNQNQNRPFRRYVVIEEFIANHLDLIRKRKFTKGNIIMAKILNNGKIITRRGFVIPDINYISLASSNTPAPNIPVTPTRTLPIRNIDISTLQP